MTVSGTYTPPQYFGDGTTTQFSFPFNFFSASDLVPTLLASGGTSYITPAPVLNGAGTYDYSVSGTQDAETGEYLGGAAVTFNNAPPSGSVVTITRSVARTQLSSFTDNGPLPAKAIESEFDRLTMLLQEADAVLALAIVAPASDVPSPNMVLPPAAVRANQTLGFDADGNVVVGAAATAQVSTVMQAIVNAGSVQAAFNLIAAEGGFVGGSLNIFGGLTTSGGVTAGGAVFAVGGISTSGVIQAAGSIVSNAGGYVFPDGSRQTSAATGGTSGANPSATIGTTAVNGSATTFMRSDAAPALGSIIAGGTIGSSSGIPVLTFDNAGRITNAATAAVTATGNLAGADNISANTTLTSSGFGKLHESTGSGSYTVHIPTATSNPGAVMKFWAGQTSAMSLISASNFVGPFGTGNGTLGIANNLYLVIEADANGQWVCGQAFTSGGTPGGGGGNGGTG